MSARCPPPESRQQGLISVEFALLLPLLLLLILGVVDISRAIQTQMILLNISREGANLAARSSRALSDTNQEIISSLVATTPPLDMASSGMVYITKIMGNADHGVVRNVVLEQYRWANQAYHPVSKVWTCTNWASDGHCAGIPPPSTAPTVSLMDGKLSDGEVIYAVEAFYSFDGLFEQVRIGTYRMPVIGPDLSALTVF